MPGLKGGANIDTGLATAAKQDEIIDAINDISVSVVNVYGCNEPTIYSQYDEILGVFGTNLILTYTVPASLDFYLKEVEVSGSNIAEYEVRVNSVVIAKKRTYFGAELNAVLSFAVGDTYGHRITEGDVLEIYSTNSRPTAADFDARIFGVTVTPNCVTVPYVYSQFNVVSSLSSGSSADICTYTVPVNKELHLIYAESGGENIAKYDVKINSSSIASKRTYFGAELFCGFNFGIGEIYGQKLVAGDQLKISVKNDRPGSSDFEARFYGVLTAV
jgi:hypothetical protein